VKCPGDHNALHKLPTATDYQMSQIITTPSHGRYNQMLIWVQNHNQLKPLRSQR